MIWDHVIYNGRFVTENGIKCGNLYGAGSKAKNGRFLPVYTS